MAVVSVQKTSAGREAAQEEGNVRRYVDTYVVVTDSLFDTAHVVLSSASLPAYGNAYPTDLTTKAWNRRAKSRANTKNVWDVEIEYFTRSTTNPETTIIESPFEAPVEYAYRTMHTSRVLLRDTGGNPYVNSAREPYDAADLTLPHATPAVIVTFNRPTFNIFAAQQYTLAVNSIPFLAFGMSSPARTVLVWDISAEPGLQLNGWSYARISIEFHFNPETWDLRLLDAGHRRLATAEETAASDTQEKYTLFVDANGQTDPVPRLLDGAGRELPPGGQVQYHEKREFHEEDLNQLEYDF